MEALGFGCVELLLASDVALEGLEAVFGKVELAAELSEFGWIGLVAGGVGRRCAEKQADEDE